MIYFIQAIGGGLVKIGSSDVPASRRAAISNLFPYGVEIVATASGGKVQETFLHHCLAPRLIGAEWFAACVPVWKLLIDAVEGKLGFLPPETKTTSEEITAEATRLFGSLEKARERLGYSSRTPIAQTFGRHGARGYAVPAKLAFHRALIEGTLPSYIAELHGDLSQLGEAA